MPFLHVLAWMDRAACGTAAWCPSLDVQNFICSTSWSTLPGIFHVIPTTFLLISFYCLPSWKLSNALWRLFRTHPSSAPRRNLRLSLQIRSYGMKLITETTELWVSISKNVVCFNFFCAGSGLSTTYKALKALALKSKAEIMPSPTKRIIHLLFLSVTMMWFLSDWCDQHLARLYSSCHSLTLHELEIKRACCAEV